MFRPDQNTYPLFDTHCHLDVSAFDEDRDQVLASARNKGVVGQLIPAIRSEGWAGLLDLCAAHGDLYPALGLHPVFVHQHRDEDLDHLAQKISDLAVVSLGEIGLDYAIEDAQPDRQLTLLDAQLALAHQHQLPVVLHCRKAHEPLLARLKASGVRSGIIHAFNGSMELAHRYLDLGLKLGFGGMLTFERSSRLRRLAASLPLEGLVLETDAPDLTVAAHRGERNSPAYLPWCLQALAEVRQADPAELAQQTSANALAVFSLS
jgi:TatD DNase family protein